MNRFILVAAALATALSGCGRFQRASDVAATTTPPSFITLPPLATTTASGRPSPATSPPAPAKSADPCAASNTASRDDPSGFRVQIAVGDKPCYLHTDDFTLTLTLHNPTTRDLYYDPNQDSFFDMIPEGNASAASWSDTSCRTRSQTPPSRSGSFTLAPGDAATRSTAVYPAAKSQATREQCRVLDGTYVAYATLRVCGDASCSRVAEVQSASVRIVVR